jgi:hypothetical protein
MKRMVATLAVSTLLWSCGGDKGTNDGGGNQGGDPKLTQVGFIPVYGATGVFVSGSTAYVVADSGFYIIDVTNPAIPVRRSFLAVKTPFSGARDVFVAGATAYIADYNSGLVTVDVTDPSNPDSLTQWVDGVLECSNVQVANGYAYLAYEDSGLVILNVSNPASPTLAGRIRIPARDVALVGSTLSVLCTGDTLLRVYSVTAPGSLVQTCAVPKAAGDLVPTGFGVSTTVTAIAMDSWDNWVGEGIKFVAPNCGATASQVTEGYAQNVTVKGPYVIVGDYGIGVRVFKYSTASAPVQIDFTANTTHPDDMFELGDYLFVTDDDSGDSQQGLYVFRFATP